MGYGSSRVTEEATAPGPAAEAGRPVVIGRDVGWAGRTGRIVAGLLAMAWLAWHIPLWPEPDLARAGIIAVWSLAILVVYTLAYHLLGMWPRLQHGWIAATLLLGPPFLVFVLHLGPAAFHEGLALYIAASLTLNGLIAYGGCEVIAVPTLVWRTRHVAYCPWNAVDAVERSSVEGDPRWRPWTLVSLALAAAVVAYFVIWDHGGVALWFGTPFLLDDRVGLLLLLPAGYFALRGWTAYRANGRRTDTVRIPAVAAVALAAMAVAFSVGDTWRVWGAVMVVGLAATVAVKVRRPRSAADMGGRPE